MSSRKRVVITGLGCVTPVGTGIDNVMSRLYAGESGIGPITQFDSSDYDVHFAGECSDFDPLKYLPKRELRRHDRFSQLAVAAADEALGMAGLEFETVKETGQYRPSNYDRNRIGTFFASGMGGLNTIEEQHCRLLDKGPSRVSPFLVPKMMPNAASGQVSIRYGLAGANFCTVSACASGAHALGEAFHAIQIGQADMVLAGGAESTVTTLGISGFTSLKALSTRNDDPERASRPFDKDRDGFVLAEGAGALVLESLESAQARGATILAEMVGYGASADAYHLTEPAPGGDGSARAMKAALDEAGVTPDVVQYINAHGTSTPYNDRVETQAIHRVFGDHARKLAINSTKSMIGHTLGGAGAIELAVTIRMIREGRVHPTINYTTPDPDCDLDYCPNEARDLQIDYAMSNSLGFGGHNGVLLVKRFEA